MSFENIRDPGLDYRPCTHGAAKPVFRGPPKAICPQAVVALGGTQTFGKFIAEPWPERLERSLGRPVVNLGSLNASADLYLGAPDLLARVNTAAAVVVELCGAAGLSNRFYSVHPLRNDRFLSPDPALTRLYPEVDFTEFAFVRHMLAHLVQVDARRFATVAATLQETWQARMTELLARLAPPVIGLWLADGPAPARDGLPCGPDPLLVTAPMLDALRPALSALVTVTPGAAARAPDRPGRVYSAMDMQAAMTVFPARIHQQIANALVPRLEVCTHRAA